MWGARLNVGDRIGGVREEVRRFCLGFTAAAVRETE